MNGWSAPELLLSAMAQLCERSPHARQGLLRLLVHGAPSFAVSRGNVRRHAQGRSGRASWLPLSIAPPRDERQKRRGRACLSLLDARDTHLSLAEHPQVMA
jgi:hypothetical protein